MTRLPTFALALTTALLSTACVLAPGSSRSSDPSDVARMGEQAIKTCGEGQVKEVNTRSFSCK
ncbi:hypothetical protein PEC18_06740 [Paucibacter sp. O1-1]|nr:hypothetical protein [Paucibacter sp. O1-1]MDA3825568.1 hypothetical protein [Paucibacter sp. O1-1]